MNRIRGGATFSVATFLGVALLLAAAGIARAQEISGRVTGRVTDQDTGAPLGGVTVIAQGPQGEDATLTDDTGEYRFTSLPVGVYVIRFYVANASTQVEQGNVQILADKTIKVNAKIASAVQAAAQQTYVITGRPPAVDVGSARIGAQFDQDYTSNIPLNRTYGDVISRAPGTFVDPSGNVSIGGATGIENIYIVNGMNVTGIEYGNLEAGTASLGGGTNLPLEFLTQIDVNSGGYKAEYGGGMGGVINSVLKSGSNEFHGSVFSYWSPYWLSSEPNPVTTIGRSLGYVRKPDFDTSIGAEVGGPIIKDKLFFWAGFAPRFQNTHVFRQTYLQLYDPTTNGAVLDASGNPLLVENTYWRARIPESRKTYYFGATVDFHPRPEHHLTVALLGTPNFNDQMRSFQGVEFIANPAWSQERLTKTNTDLTAHWVSKLYGAKWQIDAIAGMHSEYFNMRSPHESLNSLNQQWFNAGAASLWDLERAPGCQPIPTGDPMNPLFQPCPVDNYKTGGFGFAKKYTGYRWSGEVKSTHQFEGGGHHEVKYGWHVDLATFDQDRYYTGPAGARGLVFHNPGGSFDTYNFFTLNPGEYPSSFGPVGSGAIQPYSNLLHPYDPATMTGGYKDNLQASVKSLSNAFFLQDSFNPQFARNLSINVGGRFELQKMYDYRGGAFLDAKNFGPRVGVVYDPFNDGRSKVSFSYGRYYEAIPLSIAARYFGGEGIMVRQGVPTSSCANQDPLTWTGAGEWRQCNIPPQNTTDPSTDQAGGFFTANNGANYPVQANLQGQYHNEVVATAEREVMEDTTVRLDYQHRWIGNIIEDGSTDSGGYTFVLANPGNVPQSAIEAANREATAAQTAADAAAAAAMAMPNDPQLAAAAQNTAAAAANAQAKAVTLADLAKAPKPTRNYDAITVSLNHKFSKNWMARASYTYSRLTGNYEGLYQTALNYFAPNGNNAYDLPDLTFNNHGPLPNDRPHVVHVDGYYTTPVGNGTLVFGLQYSARSGMPRNYMSQVVPGQSINFLLPRGAGGRTPTVTELNGRIAYRRALGPKTTIEAFLDLFNILNQQTTLMIDENYTFDWAPGVVNGTEADLKFAKNIFGQSLTKNPNYGNALLFQRPFNARMGIKLTF